jgi:hypothetical protein
MINICFPLKKKKNKNNTKRKECKKKKREREDKKREGSIFGFLSAGSRLGSWVRGFTRAS